MMRNLIIVFFVFTASLSAEVITVAPEYEERYQQILSELRCLVCQNQTIADSPSDLAVDFRVEVRDMLEQGKSNQEILDFMSARYGDFVLYKPPVKPHTWLLWAGPFLFLIGGVAAAIGMVRKRASEIPNDPLNEQDKQRLHDLLDKENI
ncbi:MAG: cytochrome c-type biogenesis protein [Pseudomonadota bacterium]